MKKILIITAISFGVILLIVAIRGIVIEGRKPFSPLKEAVAK